MDDSVLPLKESPRCGFCRHELLTPRWSAALDAEKGLPDIDTSGMKMGGRDGQRENQLCPGKTNVIVQVL